MSTPKIRVDVVDVNGSFKRFIEFASKGEARKRLHSPVLSTAAALETRMRASAPVGPGEDHIKNAITFSHRATSAQVGLLSEDFGGDPAGDGSNATMAEVALYNEYNPNKQPFMRAAAEAESKGFERRIADVLKDMENALGRAGL
jgi:hypothetical protein